MLTNREWLKMSVLKPQPGQVWWLNQSSSRTNTEPPQPNDDTKEKRMFYIVASGAGSNKVTACPIQSVYNSKVGMTEVVLLSETYLSFLRNKSKVVCHDIVTVPINSFSSRAGVLSSGDKESIKTAIKFYLKIM